MLMATAIGLLCGALLGTRFRVLALVPAHAAAMTAFGCVAAAGELDLSHLLLAMLGWSLGCHGGYVAAALLKAVVETAGKPVRRAQL